MKTIEIKVLTIVCLCTMCAWALNTTTIDNKTFYQIATCQDMVDFADLVNTPTSSGYGGYGGYGMPEYGNKSANAIVTAAIDMTCTDAFPMIGAADDNRRYVGTFDGQNFPIRGLKLTANTQNVGLFAAIGEGAYIKNMVVQDVEITGTLGNQTDYPSIGGMVGWMHNGTIEGCYVSGIVKGTAEKEAIGGVVGNAWGGTIKDCLSEVTVIGEKNLDYVGGIVGYAKGEGNDNTQAAGVTISSCVFNGDVVANGAGVVIGGIVGTCDKEQFIVNSFYSGEAANYGVGSGANNSIATVATHFTRTGGANELVLNSEETVCKLNGGTWNNNVCSGATSDVWSSGDGISNGAGTFDNNGNAYYTISFSANGGDFAEGATTWKKLSRGTQISSNGISQPTRTNYAFVGWSKNQNASTGDANLGNVEKAVTIYAVWNYSVTFNSNGGSSVATKYVATSGNATVTAPANPTKTGYDFGGWYKESGLKNKWNFANDKVTSSITLYAKWTPKKYTFTTENATIASPSADGKYDYGSQVTLNATVPEHYHFVKWEDGNTDNPRTVTVGETNTYKAVVAIDQFKVTFYDENGTTVLKSETLYDYGTSAANIAKPSNPTKSATAEFSYEFSGWSPALAEVTENVNYVATYASSRVKYTLTWNFDGGAAAGTAGVDYTKAGQVENAASITYPTVSKDKYDFDGWSPAGVTAMPAHNQTFTALWKVKKVEIAVIYGADATKDSIHIIVNATDDESSVVNQIEVALEAKDITPTKEQTATTVYTYNGEWVQNTSGEYVAQFDETAREYTVTLNVPDGATVSPSMTKYAAGTATNLPSANLDGWTFVGWVDGSGNSVTQIAADATGDKAYTAVFTKDITVVYGEGAGDKLQVEIEQDDSEAEIIAKIEAALEAEDITPAKSADADSTYEFTGWNIDGDMYIAEFEGTVKTEEIVVVYGTDATKDTIHVVVDVPDNVETRIVKLEAVLEERGITPAKASDADSTYAFSGWDVDGNTFTAEFKGSLITETVIVKYGEGAGDQIEVIVPKAADTDARIAIVNDSLTKKGITPAKASDADSTYAFSGWDVDGNTFTAEFKGTLITETVVVKYGEGAGDKIEVIVPKASDENARIAIVNDSLTKKGITPAKAEDADSTYAFSGWDVDGNTYTAEFKGTLITETVVVKYGEGAGDRTEVVVPKAADTDARIAIVNDSLTKKNITPAKAEDADSTYAFSGWDVDGNTFTAEFQGTLITETVIVKYGAGAGDQVEVIVPKAADTDARIAIVNDSLQKKGITPTKASDADSTYAFDKWDVDGNTFTAEFEGTLITETVVVKYGEGAGDQVEVIVPKAADKDARIAIVNDSLTKKGITPAKAEDADSTYAFSGWDVDGNSFTAEFKGTLITETVIVKYGEGAGEQVEVIVPKAADTDARIAIVNDSLQKKGITPAKAEDADSTYAFSGWDVDGNTFTAEFKGTLITETVIVKYGEGAGDKIEVIVPKASDENARIAIVNDSLTKKNIVPTKSADADSTYAFSGWDVDGNTFTAEFQGTLITETVIVKFGAGDGDQVEVIVPKAADTDARIAIVNDSLTKKGITPAKAEDADSTYAFSGWDVDGNTFTAEFEGTLITETVIVKYGAGAGDQIEVIVPKASDENARIAIVNDSLTKKGLTPAKASDADSTYAFSGWDVDGNTYTAEFKGTLITETVVVKYGEGAGDKIEVIVPKAADTDACIAIVNDSLTKKGITPAKASDADSTYAFSGWDVDGNTYTAEFKGTLITETVIVKYGEGAGDQVEVIVPKAADENARIAIVNDSLTKKGITPAKAEDADSTYAFSGWDVDGNTFTAEFEGTLITETVIVKYGAGDGDQVEVIVPKAADTDARIAIVNDSLQKKGITPAKAEDADSTYEFTGWNVDGNTFTAEFQGTLITETVIVKYGEGAGDKIEVIVPKASDENARIAIVNDSLTKKGITPAKASDADSTYAFSGWDVDGNTFTAEFEGTLITETVVVKYGEGDGDQVEVIVPKVADTDARIAIVNDSLTKKNIVPTKSADADSTYAFSGWDVDGNTFTAEFEGTPKYIEVVVGEDTVKVVVPEDPTSGTGESDSIIVEVKVVVDGDTVTVPVIDGDILDSAAKKVLDSIPTKDDSADSSYEFAGWEQIKDSTGKPIVDKNGNKIYEPIFEADVKKETVVVSTGDSLGSTIEVVIKVTDTDTEIQEAIKKAFEDNGVPLPSKSNEKEHVYTFNKFVRDSVTGTFEPAFEKQTLFRITYVLPKKAEMTQKLDTYVFGKRTALPESYIVDGDEWEFKGWYTERSGLGDRIKMVVETDRRDMVLYPLFQKTISYSISGVIGEAVVIYDDNSEKNVVRALDRVAPEDYEKDGVTYTFSKWELENDVYVAKFTESTSIRQVVAPRFSVAVLDRTLAISGARKGSKIAVYDMRGQLKATSVVLNGTQLFDLDVPGSYIVRVNNQSVRVNLR